MFETSALLVDMVRERKTTTTACLNKKKMHLVPLLSFSQQFISDSLFFRTQPALFSPEGILLDKMTRMNMLNMFVFVS